MLFANFKNLTKSENSENTEKSPNSSSLVEVRVSESQFSTNQVSSFSKINQSTNSFEILSTQMPAEDPNSEPINQDDKEMLQEKMILDPVISMVLFNEYIPLQRREPKPASEADSLNKSMQKLSVKAEKPSGVFIKSELPVEINEKRTVKQEGLFLRSISPESVGDDWVRL